MTICTTNAGTKVEFTTTYTGTHFRSVGEYRGYKIITGITSVTVLNSEGDVTHTKHGASFYSINDAINAIELGDINR